MKLLSIRAAVLAALALVFAGSALRAQTYDQLRAKWADGLTGGNFTPDATLTSKVADLDALVGSLRSAMVAGTPPASGYLFPEANLVSATLGTSQVHAHITKTYENLSKLALALRTKGSAYEFTGSGSALATATRDDVKRGLEWMYLNAYQPNLTGVNSSSPVANWWDLEIGASGGLGNILCLLSTGPFLGGANGGIIQTDLTRYSDSIIWKLRNNTVLNGSGANGAWRARTWTLLGALRQNKYLGGTTKDYLAETQARLDGFLASPPPDVYTWDSEGFHPDGTFLGHIILPYAGAYGAQMIDRLAELAQFYNGTTWTTSTLKTSFVNWVAACEAQTYQLQFFQNVRGRSLTRYTTSNTTALGLCLTTIWVGQIVSGQDQADMHALVRHWLDDTGLNLLTDPSALSIPQYLRVKDYYANYLAGAAALADADEFRVFPYGGTAVVRRPAWAASVNSFSRDFVSNTRPRIKSNENNNGETPRGGFLAHGALQVLTPDLDAFANGYYENLEWKRIPGTTVDIDLEPTGAYAVNTTNWSGGASTGRLGVFGFELQPLDATVDSVQSADIDGRFHARKGWFFFDQEIVALGSDIRRTVTTVDHKIHTNVENRKLRTDNANTFKTGTSASPGTGGTMTAQSPTLSATSYALSGITRAWVSGNTTGTSMGYYFPGGAGLNYTRVQRTTTTPSPAPAVYNPTANYLMLWLSHGVPSSGKYAYVLLPGATEAATNTYADAPPITVLRNDATAQVVRKVMPTPTIVEKDETLDATGALFFDDSNTIVTLPGDTATHVRSSRQGALMVEETEAKIVVTLSDVTWQQTGITNVEIGKQVSGWETKDADSTVDGTYPTIRLQVKVDAAKGAGQTFTFIKRHEFGSDDNGLFIDNSSGDPAVKYLTGQTGADGDRILSFNADATGDYITFKAWHQMAGSYKAVLRVKKSANRGKMKVYLGTTNTPTTQIGSEIDLYSATDQFQTIEIPIAAFAANGDRFIKFEVSGKNASSSGYRLVLDSIEFKPI